jgi:hypothetical protein
VAKVITMDRVTNHRLARAKSTQPYKIFVSHGSNDSWLAGQIMKEIEGVGASGFLDETNIPKGSSDFKKIIRQQVGDSRELIALFTPWSAMRS